MSGVPTCQSAPPWITPELATAYPCFLNVRQGQLDVSGDVPWVAGFSTEGISKLDAIHYDAMGQIEFGQRLAHQYLDLISLPEPSAGILSIFAVLLSLGFHNGRRDRSRRSDQVSKARYDSMANQAPRTAGRTRWKR